MFKEKITIISTIVTTLSAVLILWERLYNLPPYLMILFIILTIASFTLIFAKKESSLSKKVVYFFVVLFVAVPCLAWWAMGNNSLGSGLGFGFGSETGFA